MIGHRSGQVREETSAKRGLVVVAAVVAFSLGLSTSTVLAAEAMSSWYRFFGPTSVGGTTQCADQKAIVNNTSDAAFGGVRARYGANCNNPNGRPAGHLGTIQFLIRDATGVICGFKDWTYNSSNNVSEMYAAAFWTGPNSNCPSGAAYHASTKGRYWRTDTQGYVTSGQLSNSPSLNF